MKTYTCQQCRGTFETTWSDEEAADEARANFTPDELADVAVVCDDCYWAIMAFNRGMSEHG